MHAILNTLYPPQCVTCDEAAGSHNELCATCWKDMTFIDGCICEFCGMMLENDGNHGESLTCDACLNTPRPWRQGRSALIYTGLAKKIIYGLRHSDRTDFCIPAAIWMQRAATSILHSDQIIIPIPIHRRVLWKRRYNQTAILAQELAKRTKQRSLLNTLRLTTLFQKDHLTQSFEQMQKTWQSALAIPDKKRTSIEGQDILIVDDLMWNGAAFHAASHILYKYGAKKVSCLALARAGYAP